jgi:hypothetical protein
MRADRSGLRLRKEISNWRVFFASMILAVPGLAMVIGSKLVSPTWKPLDDVLSSIGALLVGAVGLAFLWDFVGRRALTNEVLALTNTSTSLRDAGIVNYYNSYIHDLDWRYLFASAHEVDVSFIHGKNWHLDNRQYISEFVARKDTILRIIFPDYKDPAVLSAISLRRMVKDREGATEGIREELKGFVDFLLNALPRDRRSDNVQIYLSPIMPVRSYYRFDHKMFAVMFPNVLTHGTSPALEVRPEGTFGKELLTDFDVVIGSSSKVDAALELNKTQELELDNSLAQSPPLAGKRFPTGRKWRLMRSRR